MKLPKSSSKKPLFLILIFVLVIFTLGVYLFFLQPKVKTLDNFPIWLMRDSKVTVYREMKVDKTKDEIKKTIVIQNLSDKDQENLKIYEVIPKEVAQKASDLQFSIQPEIIENDPVVLWSVGKPGDEIRDPSWKDTFLFLPKMGAAIVEITAKSVVAKASGICETKTAKEWLNQRGTKNPGFFDCVDYMGYIQQEVQERQTKEWQNKLEENKITTSIDSTNSQYKEIKGKAKEIIKKNQVSPSPAKSAKKISKEEAIEAVKKQYPKPLEGKGDDWWPAATCNPNNASYVEAEQKWHVICIRPKHPFGDVAHAATCEGQWFFFTVDNNGKANQEGWYHKCKLDKDGSLQIGGKSMWGVK